MFQSLFNYRKSGLAGQQASFRQMTPAELQQRLEAKEQLLILDVRSPGEYSGDGHIAGSHLLPLPSLHQRSRELPKDQPIVCVCRSGNRSQVACQQLAGLGFTQLYNLSGGMIGWQRTGLPIE